MSEQQLVLEVRLLARTQAEQSKIISKTNDLLERLIEAEIRREEKEKHQATVNCKTEERLVALEAFKRDIEIKRSGEAKGIEVLSKYWWVLLLAGGFFVYKITNGSITIG